MRKLTVGLLVGLALANAHAADTKMAAATNFAASGIIATNDAAEMEYTRIVAEDDAAHRDIDKWINDANAFKEKGAPQSNASLNLRIRQRLATVKKEYEDFLMRYPGHVRGHIVFGSFLNESGEESEAIVQWEKARLLDPKNPAAWNNLANSYAHTEQVKKALEYYEKAIELKPDEPLYYQNLATHVYLFRTESREYYKLADSEVLDKALDLYRKAMKLDPENFILASDYAQGFYGVNPPRYAEGLVAWKAALKIARDDIERQGVQVHLARIEMKLGHYEEARQHLEAIKDPMYESTKVKLTRSLEDATGKGLTNAPVSVNVTEPK